MILSGETNKVFFSAHLKADYPVFFRRVSSVLGQYGIVVGLLGGTADYWCRDYMPIQVGEDRFVKYKYSPDYLDHPASRCYVTNVDKAIEQLDITPGRLFDLADIVLDGGNVVKTPSHVIMTEKVFVENPDISRTRLISRLEDAFQAEIIIVPWANRREDPCGHTDGMVRYVKGRELLLDNYSRFDPSTGKRIRRVLEGKGYVVHELDISYAVNNSWAYVNFLQTANVIVVPRLGIAADQLAYNQLRSLFNVPVEPIPAPGIIRKYGGAFNCLSWNIKTACQR